MSYEVKKRGSSWRARVRIYGIPAKTATFDTHREAHDWAVIKNGELLAEKKSAEKLLVNSPVVPASITIPSNSNPLDGVLVSTILKEYWRTVLPNKVSIACDAPAQGVWRFMLFPDKRKYFDIPRNCSYVSIKEKYIKSLDKNFIVTYMWKP